MIYNEKMMTRALELARKGAGQVSPNPMVGCVVIHKGEIIGEGYHQKYGQPHAEVNAIQSVEKQSLLSESTIFVTLEPCAHHGLTPPCADLIIAKNIPEVVIGSVDPFAKVAGKGIERLRKAGVRVTTGVLEDQCNELNKRFFTYHQKKRPYIILKWAQTSDGFIDVERTENDFGEPTWITGEKALKKVHEVRAVEDSILVGTNTALKDNPSLTVRHCEGRNPVRLVTDRSLRLPNTLNLFNKQARTIVFNGIETTHKGNVDFRQIDYSIDIPGQILSELYKEKILSVIVEGGKQLLDSFIKLNLWDEAHVFIGDKSFYRGIKAPLIHGKETRTETYDKDKLFVYLNAT